jgi:hypothetical protein
MRENRPCGSEGGAGESPSRPLSLSVGQWVGIFAEGYHNCESLVDEMMTQEQQSSGGPISMSLEPDCRASGE